MAGLAPGAARREGRLPWTGRCPDETVGGEEEPGEPLPEEFDSSWVNNYSYSFILKDAFLWSSLTISN